MAVNNNPGGGGLIKAAGVVGGTAALAKQDATNNLLAEQLEATDAILRYSKLMYENISFIAKAIAESNEISMLELKKREEQIRDERLSRASVDPNRRTSVFPTFGKVEDKGPVGGLLGQLLGLLKGVVLGGVAAVLGSEVWLYLRGLTDGTEAKRLLGQVQAFGAKLWVFGAALVKLAAPITRIIPLAGKLLRVIPGLGQAITAITGLFTGFTAGFESFSVNKDWRMAIVDGITAGLEGIVNGFVDVLTLIGVPQDTVDTLKGAISTFFNGVNRAMRNLTDLLLEDALEEERNAIRNDRDEMLQRHRAELRSARQMGLNESLVAEIEARQAQENEESMRAFRAAELRRRLYDAGADLDKFTVDYVNQNLEELESIYGRYERLEGSERNRIRQRGLRLSTGQSGIARILEERGLTREQRAAAERAALLASNGSAVGLREAQDSADRSGVNNTIIVNAPTTTANQNQINTKIDNGGRATAPLKTKDDALAAN